ncbi:hypothetical protein MHA01_31620 [Marinococcus halophilus]|uniref:Uncharacterized protein n=1 Tax=Marinococcus halophilus TaxID=1371 RepID=A0A510YD22_MARHA|nr:hypothetical protein MHA01_31620 [Marinococcus halophilus]
MYEKTMGSMSQLIFLLCYRELLHREELYMVLLQRAEYRKIRIGESRCVYRYRWG